MGKLAVISAGGARPPPALVRDVASIAFAGGEAVEVGVIDATTVKCGRIVKEVAEGGYGAAVILLPGLKVSFVDIVGRKLKEAGVRTFVAVGKAVKGAAGCPPDRRYSVGGKAMEYVGLAEEWAVVLLPKFIRRY